MNDVTTWLLDADPAIRWQVLRELTDAPAALVAAERAWVAENGWGKRLLDLQADGQWAGGACFPSRDWRPRSRSSVTRTASHGPRRCRSCGCFAILASRRPTPPYARGWRA